MTAFMADGRPFQYFRD